MQYCYSRSISSHLPYRTNEWCVEVQDEACELALKMMKFFPLAKTDTFLYWALRDIMPIIAMDRLCYREVWSNLQIDNPRFDRVRSIMKRYSSYMNNMMSRRCYHPSYAKEFHEHLTLVLGTIDDSPELLDNNICDARSSVQTCLEKCDEVRAIVKYGGNHMDNAIVTFLAYSEIAQRRSYIRRYLKDVKPPYVGEWDYNVSGGLGRLKNNGVVDSPKHGFWQLAV